ncbi:MAG: MurR/RpiR family transcriptional regulator [Clostridiaceae bacterium]|jgi:DNA-binding MurR/RpiR family transcriptional regulator|nr:MurR/RpiR family transcriptional regulator [Clostridiaceae bacterium]
MSQLKLEGILEKKEQLPRKQRELCEYIVGHIDEVDMLTAKQLADKAGIGDATVFRFLKEYGYASYAEFRAELHRYSVEFTHSSYWQMKAALQKDNPLPKRHALFQTVSDTIDLLGKTLTPKLVSNFDAAVDLMLAAPEVGVLGLRSSKSLALHLQYILMPFFPKIQQFSHDEHYIFEKIKNMPEASVLFVITSWPNTKMTVNAAEFCHQLNHKIILLTNSLSCPISSYADLQIITPEAKDRYTVVPYIAVLEALANEIGRRLIPRSIQQLKEIDEILAEQQVTNWQKQK